MSYHRDPDAMIRGVGAIASVDAGNRRSRFARQRRARMLAVRDRRAVRALAGGESAGGTVTSNDKPPQSPTPVNPLQVARARAAKLVAATTAPMQRTATIVKPSGGLVSGTSMPVAPTLVVPIPPASGGGTFTSYPGSMTQPPPAPPPRAPLKPAVTATMATTQPAMTSSTSVSSGWMPWPTSQPIAPELTPVDTAPIDIPTPSPSPSSSVVVSDRTKKLALLGGGIALLYLLFRD
jgi:hypothetical protein